MNTKKYRIASPAVTTMWSEQVQKGNLHGKLITGRVGPFVFGEAVAFCPMNTAQIVLDALNGDIEGMIVQAMEPIPLSDIDKHFGFNVGRHRKAVVTYDEDLNSFVITNIKTGKRILIQLL